jgi:hypothetical protein avisC_02045
MVDPVATSLINVGVALTSMLLNATQQSQAAAITSEARDPISFLAQSLLGRRGTKKDIERRISKDLTSRMQDMNERCYREGIDPDRLANPCAEVEDILHAIDHHEQLLEQAVHDPDAVRAFFEQQARSSRIQVDERLVPYFDELIKSVTELYITYAERSSNYQQLALKQLLKSDRENRETWAQMHETIADVPHKVAELVSSESKPSRVFFGSRPDVVAENRFVERSEQEHLNALIADPTQQRTVLVGMRGCGKTQLAAALAKQCEDANWNLVAWVNASSTKSITSDLVELAKELKKELKIDTSDQPTPKTIIHRLFDRLKSADPSDRLIVFDNVENIDDLRGLLPSGKGLRIVATTTNNAGWEHHDWKTIKVGVFDRSESIDYLLTVTRCDDHDAADALAQRLGDLPLAIAQAAGTARNKDLSLARYLQRLDSRGEELVIRHNLGDEYTVDAVKALLMAVKDTITGLEGNTKETAQRQLGALALLAESGVPTRWLDPTIEQQDNQDLQGANKAEDEDAHDALTELIHRSIIQQSADKATTMLHRLQAQAFRESWDEIEAAVANHAAAQILTEVNIDGIALADTERRRKNTRDLMHQLRSIGNQTHSFSLFKQSGSLEATDHAMRNAILLGIEREITKLHNVVDILSDIYGIHNETVQILRNDLADAYLIRGSMSMARKFRTARKFGRIMTLQGDIDDAVLAHMTEASEQESAHNYYEAIEEYKLALQACPPAIGIDARYIATIRHVLARLYSESNRIEEALAEYRKAIEEGPAILGPGHPSTDRLRVELADLLSAEGRFTDAIELLNQAYSNYSNTFGNADDLSQYTLIKLCDAHVSIGEYDKAIALYKKVLETQPPIQLSNISKQFLQHRLAGAYASAGHRKAAVTLLDSMLEELHERRRHENSESINHDYYINDLYSIEYQLASILCESEKVDDLLRATTILHGAISYSKLTWGPQHPKTIDADILLSEVSTRISNLSAITNDL